MLIQTTRFGEVEIQDQDILTFPSGMLGFSAERHFVMIEEWESIQDRINFGRSMSKEHHMKVIPYLLPNHSHEFYEAL